MPPPLIVQEAHASTLQHLAMQLKSYIYAIWIRWLIIRGRRAEARDSAQLSTCHNTDAIFVTLLLLLRICVSPLVRGVLRNRKM